MPRFTHPLPENIRKCLPKALRTCLNTRTAIEEAEVFDRKSEKLVHHQFEAWLLLNEILYDHSRMDKATTNKKGKPDFEIYGLHGETFHVEFKVGNGKLSEDQAKFISRLIQSGHSVTIAYSLEAAMEYVSKGLGME